jgi:hypothetical protein
MKQTSNNNFSKSTALFAGNKGKINGDKNKKIHNVSSSITQSTNNNKKFYKDKTCHYCRKKGHIAPTCKKCKYD